MKKTYTLTNVEKCHEAKIPAVLATRMLECCKRRVKKYPEAAKGRHGRRSCENRRKASPIQICKTYKIKEKTLMNPRSSLIIANSHVMVVPLQRKRD
ncbi:11303_t:CDS:2, partial [Acaulospora morrowiae]